MLNPFTEILTPQMFFVRELEKETCLLKSLTVWVLTKKNNPKIPKAEQKNPQQKAKNPTWNYFRETFIKYYKNKYEIQKIQRINGI